MDFTPLEVGGKEVGISRRCGGQIRLWYARQLLLRSACIRLGVYLVGALAISLSLARCFRFSFFFFFLSPFRLFITIYIVYKMKSVCTSHIK